MPNNDALCERCKQRVWKACINTPAGRAYLCGPCAGYSIDDDCPALTAARKAALADQLKGDKDAAGSVSL